MKEDSFEYCLLFVLAVVYSVLFTIIRNCYIMIIGSLKYVTSKNASYHCVDYDTSFEPVYPAKSTILYDLEVDAIERLRVIRYLDRFSMKDLKAECKAGKVSVKGCKTKASVIAEMVYQLHDNTGVGFTDLCNVMRINYAFMKGREHG
jgi:hypothetical protein